MNAQNSVRRRVSPTISKISMLIAAALMGNISLLVNILGGYSTYTIVLLRGLSGTVFLTIFMIGFHSFSRGFLKESFKMHWKPLLIIGILNPIILYLYFENILLSGPAIAAFLLYTNGIFVLAFLIVSKTEKVAKLNIGAFILAIVGVALIMEFWTGHALLYGIFLGLLSGFALGLQIFFMKKIYISLKKDLSTIKTQGDMDILLAWWPTLFIVFFFLPIGAVELIQLTLVDWGFVLLLGLLPTAIAFVLYNVGVKNDHGGNIIILSYIEPVVATIITIFIFHIFSIFTIIGGGLILIANIIVLIFSRADINATD